jgi:hypothetical protein
MDRKEKIALGIASVFAVAILAYALYGKADNQNAQSEDAAENASNPVAVPAAVQSPALMMPEEPAAYIIPAANPTPRNEASPHNAPVSNDYGSKKSCSMKTANSVGKGLSDFIRSILREANRATLNEAKMADSYQSEINQLSSNPRVIVEQAPSVTSSFSEQIKSQAYSSAPVVIQTYTFANGSQVQCNAEDQVCIDNALRSGGTLSNPYARGGNAVQILGPAVRYGSYQNNVETYNRTIYPTL